MKQKEEEVAGPVPEYAMVDRGGTTRRGHSKDLERRGGKKTIKTTHGLRLRAARRENTRLNL